MASPGRGVPACHGKKAKEAKAAQRDLSAAWEGLALTLGQVVTPALEKTSRFFADGIGMMRTQLGGWEGEAQKIGGDAFAKIRSLPFDQQAGQIEKVRHELDGVSAAYRDIGQVGPLVLGSSTEKNAYGNLAEQLSVATIKGAAYSAVVGRLINEQGMSEGKAKKQADALFGVAKAAEDGSVSVEKYTGKVKDLGDRWDDAKSAQDRYFGKVTSLLDAQMKSRDTWGSYNEKLKEHALVVDHNTGLVRIDTAERREAVRTAEELAKTLAAEDQAYAAQTNDIPGATAKLYAHRQEMYNSAIQAGMSKTEADKFLATVGMVPELILTTWQQAGLDQALIKAKEFQSLMQLNGASAVTAERAASNYYLRGKGAGTPSKRASGGPAGGLTMVHQDETVKLPYGSWVNSPQSVTAAMGGGRQMVHATFTIDSRVLVDAVVEADRPHL